MQKLPFLLLVICILIFSCQKEPFINDDDRLDWICVTIADIDTIKEEMIIGKWYLYKVNHEVRDYGTTTTNDEILDTDTILFEKNNIAIVNNTDTIFWYLKMDSYGNHLELKNCDKLIQLNTALIDLTQQQSFSLNIDNFEDYSEMRGVNYEALNDCEKQEWIQLYFADKLP